MDPTFSPMYPVFYPGLVPGQHEEEMNGGGGIYVVPVHQFAGHIAGLPSNNLIPLTYNLPTTRPSNEGENEAQGGQGQRQVVERRFQLDLFLILKLAAVIFLFHQDGSTQRLALLVFFVTIIYLYQTGALAPFLRWLSQGMHRPAAGMPLNEDAVPEGQENEADNVNPANANENENVVAGNQWWGIVKEIQMIVFGFITSLLSGFHDID